MSTLSYNVAWESIQWPLVRKRVARYQNRIYKASQNGQLEKVWELQRRLISSRDGKLLAVLRVTTNKGGKTAGVDGVKAISHSAKDHLVSSLRLNTTAKPIRRVWIPKPGKKEKRPLGIPTVRDRAKQALVMLALEPQWEARFEPNSYGFRPGRSAHDAIEAVFSALHHKTPKLIFEADLRKCFDEIDHDKLLAKLDTFPLMRDQIEAWLKAGIMEGYANQPKPEITYPGAGTPQGGIISPLLANIALHGLEDALKDFVGHTLRIKPRPTANNGVIARQKALSIVRYADDFVIIHENKEIFDECVKFAREWINTNTGLSFNEEKSKITLGPQGFKFLGFQIIQVRKEGEYKVKITPHTSNQKRLLEKVALVLTKGRSASAYYIVKSLRSILIGWANYFRYCECKEVFTKLTHKIFLKLRAWAFRRDTRNGRKVIKEKYFPSGGTYNFQGNNHQDSWILVGKSRFKGIQRQNNLIHLSWVKSLKHVKVKGRKSPYDGDLAYWIQRNKKYGATTRVGVLLNRQKGTCTMCNCRFFPGEI